MSIYGTAFTIIVVTDDERRHEIDVQLVPHWIDDEIPYLPPPRILDDESDGYCKPRAAVFVHADDKKGGEGYGSQQYHNPLLVLGGEEWERATFRDVMNRIMDALAQWERP